MYSQVEQVLTMCVYVVTLKGWGYLHVCRIPLYTPLESGFTGKSLTIPDFVRGSFLRQFRIYTPLDSTFTGESLTILDFVRENLFPEFGEFRFYSQNIVKLG